MHFSILTLFPNLFDSYLSDSIIKRAIDEKKIKIDFYNIRDFTKNKHKKVDDTPYGGGAGMVMACQPLFETIKAAKNKNKGKVIYLSPKGRTFTQSKAEKWSKEKEVILLCGRYEGIDQRVIDAFVDEEISIGQYVLTGGELPAMILIDSITRLLPNVLGNENSKEGDSFSKIFNRKKEYPQYTKPEIYENLKVPEVLLSGNHAEIEKWRMRNLKD
ncbi:tRNA (guanosine(37)-N1)-methyltransferase TrmD [Candidatus Peregrinibacteria bacterium RIFOXYB2_FULL_32_7]|nr:MAG: tRNA (guanosine(37)-N1)-methyltransferase TrmD [Candidatus Peregrinibacteria bacterium RIFOXYB2_FULL_32_7]